MFTSCVFQNKVKSPKAAWHTEQLGRETWLQHETLLISGALAGQRATGHKSNAKRSICSCSEISHRLLQSQTCSSSTIICSSCYVDINPRFLSTAQPHNVSLSCGELRIVRLLCVVLSAANGGRALWSQRDALLSAVDYSCLGARSLWTFVCNQGTCQTQALAPQRGGKRATTSVDIMSVSIRVIAHSIGWWIQDGGGRIFRVYS